MVQKTAKIYEQLTTERPYRNCCRWVYGVANSPVKSNHSTQIPYFKQGFIFGTTILEAATRLLSRKRTRMGIIGMPSSTDVKETIPTRNIGIVEWAASRATTNARTISRSGMKLISSHGVQRTKTKAN